jgi:hypothetical protein
MSNRVSSIVSRFAACAIFFGGLNGPGGNTKRSGALFFVMSLERVHKNSFFGNFVDNTVFFINAL